MSRQFSVKIRYKNAVEAGPIGPVAAVKSSFVKNIIGTVPEALLSNRGIVVVPTDSNSRADFIEAISKNVVLILGKVD